MFSSFKNQKFFPWWMVCTGVLCFILNQILFFYFINGQGFPYGIKWMILSSLLAVGIVYLFKNTKIFLLFFLLYTLVIHINLLYFRSYNTLIPPDSLKINFRDLFSLTGSAVYSLRPADLLLYLPVILMFLLHLKTAKRFPKLSCYPPLTCLGIFLLAGITYIFPHRTEIENNLTNSFRWDQTQGYLWFGFPGYVYYNLTHASKDYTLTEQEIQKIKTYLSVEKRSSQTDTVRRNILLIIVESLEAFPINKIIDNQEITPFLNSLLKDTLTFYAGHILTQVKDGMSSDGQLMLNTGLLPLQQGAACYLNHRHYPSLPGILKDQNHYRSCVTIVGHSPSMWNQVSMCEAYQYDRLYSEKDFDKSDSFSMGISDESLIEQAFPIIKDLPQPFFVQLITISSHSPFKLPEAKKRIHINDTYHPDLARYLESINYTDYALAQLFGKLKETQLLENTALIITGDHYAFAPFFRKTLTEHPKAGEVADSLGFLPLLVYNGNKTGKYDGIAGQIDIFPTLTDLLDLNTDWTGLGASLTGTQPPRTAINAQLEIAGDSTASVFHLKEAWEISDLIIRGNYFALETKLPELTVTNREN